MRDCYEDDRLELQDGIAPSKHRLNFHLHKKWPIPMDLLLIKQGEHHEDTLATWIDELSCCQFGRIPKADR